MRKTIFNNVISNKLLNAVRRGASRREAAKQAGIHPKTLSLWLVSNKEEFIEFSREFLAIESEYDIALKENIADSGDVRIAFRLYQERNKDETDRDETAALIKILNKLQPSMTEESFNELIQAIEKLNDDN